MAFAFDPNQSVIDGAAAVFQLVTRMVASGWTVHAWSNGAARVTGGAGLTAAGLSTDGCEMRPVRATSTWTAGQGLRLLFANASAKMYFRARL